MTAAEKFGLSSPGLPALTSPMRNTEDRLGTQARIASFYVDWTRMISVNDLRAVAGRQPMMTWEPWVAATQEGVSLADVVRGKHDPHIRTMARIMASYERPVLIRFAHEFNGNWYPWGRAPSEEYVGAYRRIVDIFRSLSVNNVRWVWGPNVEFPGSNPVDLFWPGDRYVDYIGIDGYNNPAWSNQWLTPSQLFSPTLTRLRRLSNRPKLICETGCAEGPRKAEWITDLIRRVRATTDILRFCWFDFNKPGEPDWRIASSKESLAAFKAELLRS